MEMMFWLDLLLEAVPYILIRSAVISVALYGILCLKKRTCRNFIWVILLVVYLNGLYEATLGINGGYRISQTRLSPQLLPHLIKDTEYFQAGLNVLLFLPLGLLVPMIFAKADQVLRIIAISFLLSFIIETLQYFAGRSMDINDMLLNTAGGLVGWLIFRLLRYFIKKERVDRNIGIS